MPTAAGMFYFKSKQGVKTKPAIVLIHGAGGDHLHWPYNLRRLGEYRVFAPDLPGHGKSPGIGEQSIQGYAEAIVRWLDEIGIAWAVFVGHSMGGAIAQTLALEYPEYVTGLALVSTGARLRVNAELLELLSVPASAETAINQIVKWSYSKNANKSLVKQVKKRLLETRPTVTHGDFVACNKFDAGERLREIKAPTSVVCGTEDKMTPPALSEELAAGIPNAALTLVPGAGHMVMLEKPDAVAKVVWEYLGKLR